MKGKSNLTNYKLSYIANLLLRKKIKHNVIDGVAISFADKLGRERLVGTGKITSFPSNPLSAYQLAKDKNISLSILGLHGFKTPAGSGFCISDDQSIEEIIDFANKLKYPIVIKPNDGRQGNGVELLENEEQLLSYIRNNSCLFNVYRIEKPLFGQEYRLLFCHSKILYSFKRTPGTCFAKNISNGSGYTDYSNQISEEIQKYALKVSKCLGLNVFAIDIFCNGDFSTKNFTVLEVNGEPGLKVPFLENDFETLDLIFERTLNI